MPVDPRRGFGGVGRRLGGAMDGFTQDVADAVVPKVVEAIDMNDLLERVDVDDLLDRIDVDKLLSRIDVDRLLGRIDVQALLDRVDVNKLMSSVDMDALVERTEIGSILAKSTSGLFTQILDTVRRQGVGLDGFLHRWVNRVIRRHNPPLGPPLLVPEPVSL